MNVFAILLALTTVPNYSNSLPPLKYQGNPPPAVIIVVDNTNSKDACGVAEKGWRLMACEGSGPNGVPVLIMPNPCIYPEAWKDPYSYAHLLCHEFGHANGWNAKHDN
jgi:hypothetical protein